MVRLIDRIIWAAGSFKALKSPGVPKYNPLHPRQYAYRARSSTDTVIYQLMDVLRDARYQSYSHLSFLNVESAFDNTSHAEVRNPLNLKKARNTLAPRRTTCLKTSKWKYQ